MTPTVEVVELCPLKATSLMWRPQRAGAAVLTIICKATFSLAPGTAKLAEVQDDPNLRDLHAENNPSLGLHSASDFAPYKPRADVTVVGRCYSKPHELARVLLARVKVGSVDKRIEVHAERVLMPDGSVVDDKFFSKMAIGYERAAGGAGTANPVGVSLQGQGRQTLPNLQLPGERIVAGTALTPVGLGPIPPTWPGRVALTGGRKLEWVPTDSMATEIPADWNWAFFNVGPADQQLAAIANDEAIHLEHLHPEEPVLEMRLPGIYPCTYMEQAGEAHRVAMKADTLWIDTNRLVQTVTWRAQVPLENLSEPIRVLVAKGEPNHKPGWDMVWGQAEAKKHRARAAAANKPTRRVVAKAPAEGRATSPIPLLPGSDHSPGWLPVGTAPIPGLPPVSSNRGGVAVEVALDEGDARLLRELCKATGQDPVEALRLALRDAHEKRFGSTSAS